jgi:hypothetical protein
VHVWEEERGLSSNLGCAFSGCVGVGVGGWVGGGGGQGGEAVLAKLLTVSAHSKLTQRQLTARCTYDVRLQLSVWKTDRLLRPIHVVSYEEQPGNKVSCHARISINCMESYQMNL